MNSVPSVVPSLLGPVSVKQGQNVDKMLRKDGLLGTYDGTERVIRVRNDMPEANVYQVLGHEMMHMILNDSGVSQLVGGKMEEAVCDAFGTWFASAVMSGKLSIGE